MKKKVVLILLSMLCLSGIATAAWTPLRLCLLPEIAVPVNWNVYGINFGVITGNFDPQTVAGIDIAFMSTTSVEGLQASLANINSDSKGLQVAGVNVCDNFAGVQLGIFNSVNDSSYFQLGLCNESSKSKGFQIGLINLMDNGFLPFFPIFNFSVE